MPANLRLRLAGFAIVAAGFVAPASLAIASPIVYTFSGTGTAWFNGTTYTDQLVTFTVTADTDGITLSSPGTHSDDLGLVFPYNPGITTVSLGGILDTLADFPGNTDTLGSRTSVRFSSFGQPPIGITDPLVVLNGVSGYGILGGIGEALAFFDLAGGFGPVTVPGAGTTLAESGNGEAFHATTSGGGFYWITAPTTITFSAAPPVPLPAGLWLLLSGLSGLGFVGARRPPAAPHRRRDYASK